MPVFLQGLSLFIKFVVVPECGGNERAQIKGTGDEVQMVIVNVNCSIVSGRTIQNRIQE